MNEKKNIMQTQNEGDMSIKRYRKNDVTTLRTKKKKLKKKTTREWVSEEMNPNNKPKQEASAETQIENSTTIIQ